MMRSVMVLGIALATKNCCLLTQDGEGLIVGSQNPNTGLQEKSETNTTAIHQAKTRLPTM